MSLRTAYLCFGILLLLAESSHQASPANSLYYVGAVAEYYPVTSGSNATLISIANANNYATIVKQASKYNADVIVFPEGTLTAGIKEYSTSRTNYTSHSSFMPNETEGVVLCDNDNSTAIEALKIISCAARKYSMYVLVNVNEKENCTGSSCPRDGYYFYSTNVVFNRSGAVISKYRKHNIFKQPGFNIMSSAQNATFVSDFNVTFGHFIGFDIIYRYPALSLVESLNVTDILFPSRWFSQLPYTTAAQVQAAWAHRNNVNLLAAGYSDPSIGSGGAGLYAGNSGIITSVFSELPSNLLLVARIPKFNETRAAIDHSSVLTYKFNSTEITTANVSLSNQQHVLIRKNLSSYTTSLVGLKNATLNETICNNGLCCNFNVKLVHNSTLVSSSNHSYYRYRLAVFNGVKTYSMSVKNGIQVCSIVACGGDTLDTCAYRYDTNATLIHPTNFTFISIIGNFSNQTSYFQLPYTLTPNLLPLNSSSYNFGVVDLNSTYRTIQFNLTSPQSSLFTYAIWGRNLNEDVISIGTASSAVRPISMILGIVMIILGIGNM